MEFYRDMFIHFFAVNHCALDILDRFLECNEDMALDYIRETINNECKKEEIIEYCENEKGMNETEIELCFQELENGF